MDFFFTQNELYWLDHLLPDAARMRREDAGEDDDSDDDDDSANQDLKDGHKAMTVEMGHIKVGLD